MKKLLKIWAVILPVLALFAATGCETEQLTDNVSVGLKADAAFTEAGQANLTLTLSAAAGSDVAVNLAASAKAQDGFTAVPAEFLSFDSSVTIAAGSTTASVVVPADLGKLSGNQAVITIASADGAKVDSDAATVYISVPEDAGALMAGANVWGIIGSFNGWAGDIAMTKVADNPETWTVQNASFGGEFKFRGNETWGDYDLGSSETVVLGGNLALQKGGANIKIDEGVYNVTLYPTLLKAVITEGEAALVPFELNWTVEYKGHQWVEGFETSGQLDVFEVSGTTPGKYYIPYYSSLGSYYEDDEYTPESYGESLAKDPETFLADMQANIDAMIANYLEYGYSLQDYFDDYVYNEAVDGTTILYYGQYAGDYEFLVLSMDETGKLDYGYKLITFTIDSDPETQYDWDIVANIREDWTAQPAEWVSGYEGQYFWVDGYAPGAAYTIIDLYTDAEIDWYLGGELKNFIGNQNSYIQTYLNEGYTPGEIFEYLGAAVDEDGYFYDYLSTYNIEGEAYVLILGFDENGQLINTSAYSKGADMGKALIDVPVYTPEPLDLSLNENWGAEFLGTFTDHQVNTYYNSETGEDEEVEEDVDLSVIKLTGLLDGEYVGTGLYEAGYLDELDETDFSDYVRYAGEGVIYTLDYYNTYYPEYGYTLADVANTAKDPWLYYSGVTEEYYGEWDVLIAGVSEDLEVTGEYALATITFDGTRLDSDPTLVVKKVVRGKADLKKAASAKRHVVKTAPAERAARAFTKRAPGKKAAARKPASLKSTSAKLAR